MDLNKEHKEYFDKLLNTPTPVGRHYWELKKSESSTPITPERFDKPTPPPIREIPTFSLPVWVGILLFLTIILSFASLLTIAIYLN